MGPTSDESFVKSAAPGQTWPDPRPDEQEPEQKAWIRPDFEPVDTALEVTAYSARS